MKLKNILAVMTAIANSLFIKTNPVFQERRRPQASDKMPSGWASAQYAGKMCFKTACPVALSRPICIKKGPHQLAGALPKTQTPFRPCGWKGVFARLPNWFTAFQAVAASKKSLGVTLGKAEKVLGKDKAVFG